MIHDLNELNISQILPLNNAHAHETSELDVLSLTALLNMACYARGVGGGAKAMLIALDQDAAYINPNFAWFKAMYERFIYIDRVIVADSARGQGIAKALYQDLFARATEAGQHRVVCEVNIVPPNPGSIAFHQAMSFVNVGEATIHNGTKTVRYFERRLASFATPA